MNEWSDYIPWSLQRLFTSRVFELSTSPSYLPYNRQDHPEPNNVLSNFIAISSILEEIYSNDYM